MTEEDKIRILVVDDEPQVRKVLQRQFVLHGYLAETAANGAEALKKIIEGNHFHLIITDENMPKMGGLLLLETLRDQKNEIPIILIGGYVEKRRVEELKAKGFAAALGKPISFEVLESAIRQALNI